MTKNNALNGSISWNSRACILPVEAYETSPNLQTGAVSNRDAATCTTGSSSPCSGPDIGSFCAGVASAPRASRLDAARLHSHQITARSCVRTGVHHRSQPPISVSPAAGADAGSKAPCTPGTSCCTSSLGLTTQWQLSVLQIAALSCGRRHSGVVFRQATKIPLPPLGWPVVPGAQRPTRCRSAGRFVLVICHQYQCHRTQMIALRPRWTPLPHQQIGLIAAPVTSRYDTWGLTGLLGPDSWGLRLRHSCLLPATACSAPGH